MKSSKTKSKKLIFSDSELECVRVIFHDYAIKMAGALESGLITEGQYEAFEVFYDKLVYFMEGKVLQ